MFHWGSCTGELLIVYNPKIDYNLSCFSLLIDMIVIHYEMYVKLYVTEVYK